MSEKFLLRPDPELADILVGLDDLVPELESVFGALGAAAANAERADHIAKMVELDRPARRVGKADRAQNAHEFFLVAGVAVGRFQRSVNHLTIDIKAGGIEAWNNIEVLEHAVDEAAVGVGLQIERIGAAGDETDRFLAEALQQRVV